MDEYVNLCTHQLSPEHCLRAREHLGWTREALAQASGASIEAITRFETEQAELREVTLQALAWAFEGQGLIFIEGHPLLVGMDVRGATPDPRLRDDFETIE